MTTYKAMVKYLRFLLVAAIALSALGILDYNPIDIAIEAVYLALVCYVANRLIAKVFSTQGNTDSAFISAHILTLIIGPAVFFENWIFFTLVAAAAMLSKYVIAYRKRHIFNPAALAVVFTAIFLGNGASWWVGTAALLPAVVIGGLWIEKKIRRWHLTLGFLIAYVILAFVIFGNFDAITRIILNTAIVFFSMVMLVEPITSPAGNRARIYFGVGAAVILVLMQKYLTAVPYTLELSLLAANVLTAFTKTRGKMSLRLNNEIREAANTMTFLFEKPADFSFIPGQFLEWVLPHTSPDSRGIKRFFTIASSPTEKDLQISTRLAPEKSSSFKTALKEMKTGEEISAADLDGDFVLPKDTQIPLVFIAGGIGITPFRSIIKYLLDNNEKRDIVLLYSNKTENDVAFRDLLSQATKVGVKTVFVISEKDGSITPEMIKEKVPDWGTRTFYVSGPEPMVEAFEKMLKSVMGVKGEKVKRDYFPGYESDFA